MNKLLICAAAALIFTGCSTSQPVDETDISKPVAGDAVSYTHLTLPTIYSV